MLDGGIVVDTHDLLPVLDTLRHLIPKGTKTLPVLIECEKGYLTFVCLSGCYYHSIIKVDATDIVASTTVLYYNTIPLLGASKEVSFNFEHNYVTMSGEYFDIKFNLAYSTVTKLPLENRNYKPINGNIYSSSLKTILNMGLDRQYGTHVPIISCDEMLLVKYPNMWVQAKSTGFPMNAVVEPEHMSLLLSFNPSGICSDDHGVVTFINKQGTLQIPIKVIQEDTVYITSLLDDMSVVAELQLGGHIDQIRNIEKLYGKEICDVAVFERGLKTSIKKSDIDAAVTVGACTGEVKAVSRLPINLWITILKAVGKIKLQILAGGGKICLRTPYLIIVTRVLN